MKSVFKICCLAILFLANTSVMAAGIIEHTKVTGIYCGIYGGANMCSVYFSKSATSSPSCAKTKYRIRMQISPGSNVGQSMLSLAMMAKSTGEIVSVQGTGKCSIWKDTEDMNSIFIPPKCVESNNTYACLP